MYTRVELITPEIAAKYLTANIANNRHIEERRVNEYAREMKCGDWILTHQGIAFGKNGALIDGQHRLMAIIRANIPVKMTVTRDVDEKSLFVLDIGRARSSRDIASLNNEPDYVVKSLAAANTLLQVYGVPTHTCTAKTQIEFVNANSDVFYNMICVLEGRTKQIHAILQSAIFAALVNNVSSEALRKLARLWTLNEVNGIEMFNSKAVLNYRERIRNRTLRSNAALQDAEGIIHCFIANTLRPCSKLWYPIKNKIVWTIKPGDNAEQQEAKHG